MFNQELKDRFINEKKESIIVNPYFYPNLFKKTEPFEEELNKDISNFTFYEIENIYKTLSVTSIERLNVIHSALKMYTDWCISEGLVPDFQNHFLEITQKNRYDYINVIKQDKMIVPKSTIIEWCQQIPNSTDAFRLIALFEGLHGKDFRDITALTIDDIDEEHKQVKLATRTIDVSSTFIAYAKAANEEERYTALTGMMQRSVPFIMSNLIIKHTPMVRNTSSVQERQRFLTQSIRIYRYLGVDQWMTNTSVINSGVIDFINRRAKEENITGKEFVYTIGIKEIKHQFDKTIIRSIFCDRYAEYLV